MSRSIHLVSESQSHRNRGMEPGIAIDRTALVVLGMHRSGTSATTRVLSLLGADLPKNLMLPKKGANETGFWESLDIYALNDEILADAGSCWHDWRPISSDWYRSSALKRFRARALEVLAHEFPRSSLLVVKDPRICRLLPFWLPVFRRFGARVKCVIPIRNPLEVAASLQRRDGFSAAKSYMLWLRHVLDAEKASRKLPRAFLAYDALLADWRTTAAQVAATLEVELPRKSAASGGEIDRFLDHRLRHYRIDPASVPHHPEVAGWVAETAKALARFHAKPHAKKARRRLDSIRAEFDRASTALGALVHSEELARSAAEAQARRYQAEAAEARTRLAQQNERIAGLNGLVEQADERTRKGLARAATLDAAVAERDARIAALEQLLVERRSTVTQMQAQLEEREGHVSELSDRVAASEAVGERARHDLAEKSERLAELEAQKASREDVITELRAALSAREDCIETLELRLVERAAGSTRLSARLERLQEATSSLADHMERLEPPLEGLCAALRARALEVAELRRAKARLGTMLEARERAGRAFARKAASAEAERLRLLHRLNEVQTSILWQSQLVPNGWRKPLHGVHRAERALPPRRCFGRVLARQERRELRLQASRLLGVGLLDLKWYVDHNPDVVLAGADPLWHWLSIGFREGRDPNPLFDTKWYGRRYPDVSAAGVNPLWHYLLHGAQEGRNPHPLFDTDWYLEQNPDVVAAGHNALAHYLTHGAREGRDPNPVFDGNWYLSRNPDASVGGWNPLVHYLAIGAARGRDPGPSFNTAAYLTKNPEANTPSSNPLAHFLSRKRRDPSIIR